eukprot:718511-Pelagomonas_calceolata.AAC.1
MNEGKGRKGKAGGCLACREEVDMTDQSVLHKSRLDCPDMTGAIKRLSSGAPQAFGGMMGHKPQQGLPKLSRMFDGGAW